MTLQVVTNNRPRLIVDAYELSEAERKEFDYLDWAAIERGEDSASFVRYRGELLDLGEFSTTWRLSRDGGLPDELAGWDGFMSDSFFSGTVVRFVRGDEDYVVVGRFFA